MKKITFLLGLFLTSVAVQAQTTLTHSASEAIDAGITVACPTETTNYLRVFDLAGEFGISEAFEITDVEFGTEVSETGDITINLYTADAIDPTIAALTPIYTGTEATTDGAISSHTLAAPVEVPAGSIVVFELAEAADGVVYRIGSNAAGQTAPSWLASDTCGSGTVDSFGFTNHYVVNVIGDPILGVDDNIADLVSVFPNPTNDVLNVNVPSNIEVTGANLYDVLGKDTGVSLVNGVMNTANLSRGVYILNVRTSAGTLTQKVVKQ